MDEKYFETSDLKLAALILSEIPESYFEVPPEQNLPFISFKIIYQTSQQSAVDKLVNDFLNKVARVSVFAYNKKLRYLRGAIAIRKDNQNLLKKT